MYNKTNITNDLVNKKYFHFHSMIYDELLHELPKKEQKHIYKWLYPNHLMNMKYLFMENKSDPVNINAQLLQKIISRRRQPKIMKWYLDMGFIQKVKNYRAGSHSTGYELTYKVKVTPIVKTECLDKKLAEKLINQNEIKTDLEAIAKENVNLFEIDANRALSEIKQLIFTENEIEETIKFFGARDFSSYSCTNNINNYHTTNTNYQYQHSNTNSLQPYYVSTFLKKKGGSKIQKGDKVFKYFLSSLIISTISDHQIYCFRDPIGMRMHSNLTILKKELRKYLSVPGLDLVNLDIANSQPLILNTLYNQDKKYLQLCESGQLWDYLMNKCGVSDRSQFKGDMFGEVFYCSLWGMNRSDKSRLFKTEFPKVWQFIYDYKKQNGKSSLPIEMQRKESNIILDTVCQQLANSSNWFATIHDSIICDRNKAGYVKQLMMNAFKSYGIQPTIRTEEL